MKKVKCGAKDCEFVESWTTHKSRGPRMCDVPDDFDEKTQKTFCSITCACCAGYMTVNKKRFEKENGIEVGGYWWLKDPSGKKDKRFEKLWRQEKDGNTETTL